ncbi:mechanosensitive ion channel family protein [Mycobacterium eburneum]|nr:mechanosensitive ion channel family protein [Mycobacterium eburneum]TDH53894.1 mechanosensitive ion channel family protein [Mycobacterium eburneum]
MPEEFELESVTHLAVILAWLVGAVVAAYLLGWAVSWVLRRLGRRSGLIHDLAELTRRPFRATLMVIAANLAVDATVDPARSWRPWIDHLLHIVVIGVITWLVASLLLVAERRVIARFGQMADADRRRRRIRTQVMTLRRLVIAIVVLLGVAAAVMTFPSFRQIGATMFASAGVLSVVAGLAAQTSLGAVFAGMQVSFSDAIRVGDVVLIEGEFGRIEEITLTYVVVQIWDQRRLVLPTTYFTTTPFENWTRNATDLFGTVEFDVDFTVPIDAMRAELERLLAHSDHWDGQIGSLQVFAAVGGFLRVRALISAADSDALSGLRYVVREGLVKWMQRAAPEALPRWRVEQPDTRAAAELAAAGYGRGAAE